MSKILTQSEVEAASEPAVAGAVAQINNGMINGERKFWIHRALVPTVAHKISDAGWSVSVMHGGSTQDHDELTVSPVMP